MEEQIANNLLKAMRTCDMVVISEGIVYLGLFKQGLSADMATRVVQYALNEGLLYRTGCAFVLSDGEKDKYRQGTVCNS